MEGLTPRQKRALQTKKEILETALQLFNEKGFDNVTVDEIVNKSNYSKGAFYVHFESKYDIFVEKFKEIDEFYVEFYETIPKDLSITEKILQLVEAQMNYMENEFGFDVIRTVFMSALLPKQNHYLIDPERTIFSIIKDLINEGKELGEFSNDIDSNEVCMFITRCMRGTLYDWVLFNNTFDLKEQTVKYINSYLKGIKA